MYTNSPLTWSRLSCLFFGMTSSTPNNLTDGERSNHLVPRSRELRQDTTIGEDLLAHCFKGV